MRLLHVLGPALAVLAAADAGDPAATDRRLQRAGAGTGLRLQALEAAARGAAYLERAQLASGSFAPPGSTTWYAGQETAPVDALCALALEMAGAPSQHVAAGRTLEALAPGPGMAPAPVLGHVVAASLTAQLVRERGGDPLVAADMARAIARAQDRATGLWFPRAPRSSTGFGLNQNTAGPKPTGEVETTHAAALGLAAAECMGGRAATETWTRMVAALARLHSVDGGWRRDAVSATSDLGSTAQAMTTMVLAREALLRRGPLALPAKLEFEGALARGRTFLLEEGADELWIRRRFPAGEAGRTCLLFDLEQALSFTGETDFEGVPPYEAVASVLIGTQRRDGGWSGGSAAVDDLAETAFAVLALTRASESLRAEAGPPTPPRAPPVWPEEGAPPPSTAIPLREAAEGLDWLEALLKDRKASRDSLRRTLLFVGTACTRPGEGIDDVWLRRAEDALLRALAGPEGVLAARLLGTLNPRIGDRLREALAADLPVEVLRAGFAALATQGDPFSLRWLCDENLSGDDSGSRFERSREALRAIPRFTGLPGPERRAAAETILQRYEGLESAPVPYTGSKGMNVSSTARSRWIACRRFVMDAVLFLSRDPGTNALPKTQGGGQVTTLVQFRQWLQDHVDPRKAPWLNR